MPREKLLIGEGGSEVMIMGCNELQRAFLKAWGQLMVRRLASQSMTYPARPLSRYAPAQPPHLACAAMELLSSLSLQDAPVQNVSNHSQFVDFTHAQLYCPGIVHPMRVPQKRTFLKNADRTL
jgi:hypothetical protein